MAVKNWKVNAGTTDNAATESKITATDYTSLIRAKALLITARKGGKNGGVTAMAADLASMLESARYEGHRKMLDEYLARIKTEGERARDKAIASYIALYEQPTFQKHDNSPVMVSASLMDDMIDALRAAGYSRDGKSTVDKAS